MTRMEFLNGKERCNPSQKRESGFTMIELVIVMVLVSVLATFIFQIMSGSLQTLIDMRNRKERGDDAVMLMEKICRETREAISIREAGPNPNQGGDIQLMLQKRPGVNSSTDSNIMVRYIWDNAGTDPTFTLRRTSASNWAVAMILPTATGSIVAENVSSFTPTVDNSAYGSPYDRVNIALSFNNGSSWETEVYPRNFQLSPP